MKKIFSLLAVSTLFLSSPLFAEEKVSEAEFLFLKSNLQGFAGDVAAGKKGIEQLLSEHPDSAYLHFLYAQYLMASGQDPQDAIEECEKSLQLDPHSLEVKIFVARLYSDQVEPAKAAVLFEEVLRKKPAEVELYMLLAQDYAQLKQYSRALAVIDRMMKINGPMPEGYMFKGTLYNDFLKNTPLAIASYQKALKLDPNFFAAYDAMIETYLKQKQPAKALTLLEKLSAQDPHNPTLLLRIALLYYDQKKYGEAIQQLNEILHDFPGADKVRYYLGTIYQEIQKFDGAEEAFMALPPDSLYFREARIRLVVQYKNQNQNEAAKKLLQDTIQLQKDVSLYYELLAAFYDEERDLKKSAEVLKQGVSALPKDERLRLLLAMVYEHQHEPKKAVPLMKQVLELNPENPTALNYLAYTYAESGKNLRKAEEMARHALEIKPDDAYVTDTLAWVLFRQGRLNEAKVLLESALKQSGDESTLYYHLGEVLLASKDPAAARAQFLKARELWQQRPEAEREQKELERIEKRLKELEK